MEFEGGVSRSQAHSGHHRRRLPLCPRWKGEMPCRLYRKQLHPLTGLYVCLPLLPSLHHLPFAHNCLLPLLLPLLLFLLSSLCLFSPPFPFFPSHFSGFFPFPCPSLFSSSPFPFPTLCSFLSLTLSPPFSPSPLTFHAPPFHPPPLSPASHSHHPHPYTLSLLHPHPHSHALCCH